MAMLENAIHITKVQEELIHPIIETPTQVLYLSELDHMIQKYVSTLCMYEGDKESSGVARSPAKVIKDALAKLLVPFYPVAGRLKEAKYGVRRLEVECNAQGVLFREAQTACTLKQVCFLKDPYQPAKDSSLFALFDTSIPIQERPLLTVQVTLFKCGGLVVGIKRSHVIMDGGGFSEFMKALGEIAKKGDQVFSSSAFPVCWKREHLAPRERPLINMEELSKKEEALPEGDFKKPLTMSTFEFSPQLIERLKQSVVTQSNGDLNYCSTFEAVVPLIWETHAKSMEYNESVMSFSFIMNARNAMRKVIPEGYYGNCFVCVSVNGVTGGPSDIVKCIRKAKSTVDEAMVWSIIEYLHRECRGNYSVPGMPKNGAMLFNDWSRFERIPDLGIGKGINVSVPPEVEEPYAVILPKISEETSVQVSLPQEIMPIFKMLLEKQVQDRLAS